MRGSWPCSSGLKVFRLTIVSTAVISKALSFSRQLPVVRSYLTRVTDCPIRSVFSVITENQSEPGPSQGFSELFSPFVIRKREGLWDREWHGRITSAQNRTISYRACARFVIHIAKTHRHFLSCIFCTRPPTSAPFESNLHRVYFSVTLWKKP